MNNSKMMKYGVGLVIIGGALIFFVVTAMQSSYAYYITVDEYAAKKALLQDHSLRLAGKVAKDSVNRDITNMLLEFNLAGQKEVLPVRYKGVVPDNFAVGREVVVEGKMADSGVFQADKLMTKCESKYESKLDKGN